MSSRKVVVVTGGAGFVGSHLIDALVEDFDVLCIDNYVTGDQDNLKEAHKKALSCGSRLVCREFDVSSDKLVSEICYMTAAFFDSRPVWAYINLACPASPVAYQSDPIATLDTCYKGTMNAMQFARMGARVLHASTSEIYGDPEVHPQLETYKGSVNTWGPRSCYDEGKRVAETLCYEHLMRGHDVRVVRIFNTYGPRMQVDDGRVVSNFIVQALKGQDITLYGDGSQTRSFCYVEDLVNGILSYLKKDQPNQFPINLGNPSERSVGSVASMVVEKLNSHSNVRNLPLPQDDPKKRNPDISVAKKVLGWEPAVSFEEGLDRTISYFASKLQG